MQCSEGQRFGENLNNSYAASGLKGHTGQDWSCGWATPIKSPYDGVAYKVLTKEHPSNDGSGFTGVFILVDTGLESFEYLIGHCNPTVTAGQQIKAGDIVATEANHGLVYSGNIQITLAMQAAGDQRGHHRHEQKRPVMKLKETSPAFVYLDCFSDNAAGTDYRDPQGNYYQVFDYHNGFNGCVDPSAPVFIRDLTITSTGYDVFVLQRFLKQNGFFDQDPTAYFGPVTQKALAAFQQQNNIEPTLGYFGPKTRAFINPTLPKTSSTPL